MYSEGLKNTVMSTVRGGGGEGEGRGGEGRGRGRGGGGEGMGGIEGRGEGRGGRYACVCIDTGSVLLTIHLRDHHCCDVGVAGEHILGHKLLLHSQLQLEELSTLKDVIV